jgi:hypothetical protein
LTIQDLPRKSENSQSPGLSERWGFGSAKYRLRGAEGMAASTTTDCLAQILEIFVRAVNYLWIKYCQIPANRSDSLDLIYFWIGDGCVMLTAGLLHQNGHINRL